jgi:hypothetical protein
MFSQVPWSVPTIKDLTRLSNDYPLQPGEVVKLTYNLATTVPLNIATVPGEYELTIHGDRTITVANDNSLILNPNNTTYSSAFSRIQVEIFTSSQSISSITAENSFVLGFNRVEYLKSIISTFTNSKIIGTRSLRTNTTAVVYSGDDLGTWGDTTTPWTSLGTLVFPYAQSGVIVIKRVV